MLMPESHIEVGCPGTWGLELLTLNPGKREQHQKPALPTTQPNPYHYTQPRHPSHRARSSVVDKSNNNNIKQ